MTFLVPEFFFASLAVGAAVVALHFIVTRQPTAAILPTARFVPNLPATATSRATRPSDLLLMLLRVLLVLAVGAALARPIFKPSREATARVILVDASRSVGNVQEVRNSALQYYRNGDAVLVFDSAARVVNGNISDSLRAIAKTTRAGNLSGALISALRAGSSMRDKSDSLELVVVSPLAANEFDAATDSIRKLWRGRARIVRAGAAPIAAAANEPVQLKAASSDPLAVTVSRLAPSSAARLVRSGPTSDDLKWASESSGALIDWPVSVRPRGATPRARLDTIGGVVGDRAMVVAAFPRQWTYSADSIRGARVVARWTDGEPAAVEWSEVSGCERSVAIPVNPIGDFPLMSSFARFVAEMTASCASHSITPSPTPAQIASLTGTGGLAARDSFEPRADVRSAIAPWLFGFAMALAIAELFVRRKRDQTVRAMSRDAILSERAA